MSENSGLTIRQHRRGKLDLPVELVVDEAHREQVRFGVASSAPEQFAIACRSLDLSSGGMGLSSRHFLPRGCGATVRVLDRADDDARRVLFEHRVRVRRVQMTGHEPTYFIGVAFVDPAPDLAARLETLAARCAEEAVDVQP